MIAKEKIVLLMWRAQEVVVVVVGIAADLGAVVGIVVVVVGMEVAKVVRVETAGQEIGSAQSVVQMSLPRRMNASSVVHGRTVVVGAVVVAAITKTIAEVVAVMTEIMTVVVVAVTTEIKTVVVAVMTGIMTETIAAEREDSYGRARDKAVSKRR